MFPDVLVDLMVKMAKGVEALHTHTEGSQSVPIIHRDIKFDNFLMNIDRDLNNPLLAVINVKLADLGHSKRLNNMNQLFSQATGTTGYKSPEQLIFENSNCTPATDIWSLGLTFCYIFTGRFPTDWEINEVLDNKI